MFDTQKPDGLGDPVDARFAEIEARLSDVESRLARFDLREPVQRPGGLNRALAKLGRAVAAEAAGR